MTFMLRQHVLLWVCSWLALASIARGDTIALIPPGAQAKFFKGTTEPSPGDLTAWRQVEFDDRAWSTGPEPFFYGEPLIGTELADMRGLYTSLYSRQEFEISHPGDFSSLTLKVLSDDGFVAWINGHEVARFNVPGGDLSATDTSGGALSEPLSIEEYAVENLVSILRPGRNILAIHGLNTSLSGSSDFVLSPSLEGTIDTSIPVVSRVLPTPGAAVRDLVSIEILFSRPVQGVEAADLLVNDLPATELVEFSPGQFVFTLPKLSPGSVAVRFRDDHGITDFASTPHPFGGGSWTFILDPTVPGPGIMLNEFLADNDRTLRDEDGDKSDWLELYNSDLQAVSLAGWWLTDDPDRPRKWRFPLVSVPANEFLVVFASGKDRTNNPALLHTNFRLSKDAGNYLALVNAAGEVVSAITNYPAQQVDVSYGRAPGAPNLVGYFVQPTPGKANAEYGSGFAPPVEFSSSSRTYQGLLNLVLSTTNAAATVRYTTNGTMPTVSSLLYEGPIQLTQAVQVRARAFQQDLLPGPVRSETFIPLSSTVTTFTSDLPVLLIHDFNRGRPPANSDTFAHIQLFEPDTNGVTSLTNLPSLTSRSIIAARGSSTEGYPKPSLKVEFQDELGFGRDVSLLGMPADPDWVLYAPNNFEPILIHNPFAHQLSRDIGRYSPRTRFVEVFLVTSGIGPVAYSLNYHGIYVVEEKIKLGDDRVDAPKLFSGQNSEPLVSGGYLMKIDRADPGDGGFYAAGQGIQYVSPKEQEIWQPDRAGQRNYLQRFMDDFGDALYGSQFRNPTNGYRAYIDVGSWIDHHLLNVLTFNVDALRLSAYFYKQREGKLHFGPLWDFDRALYSTDGRDFNPRVWRSLEGDRGTDFFNYPWWGQMFTDPDFFQDYIDRYQALRRGAFSTTNLHRLVDTLTEQVRKAQPRELTRWGVQPRNGFSGEIRSLKSWLSNRVEFMDSQFVRPPSFETPGQTVPEGFELRIQVPLNTSVYYTLDGSDPRKQGSATGNDLAASAILYSGPIIINQNTRVIARARNPNHVARTGPDNPPLKSIWSGPIAETFVTKPFSLRLTEIMYHPAGDGSGTGFEDENFEFLELHNFGLEPIDLTGFTMEGTVDFTVAETNVVRTIAPNERWLLVENAAAFARRYPGVGTVAGTYRGRLNNDGGRLALFGPIREPVFDFRYSEQWDLATDGRGPSLVLREEVSGPLPPNDPMSWRASRRILGSPGAVDPEPAPLLIQVDGDRVRIELNGWPGQPYRLEELTDAGGTWQIRERAIANALGTVEFQPVANDPMSLFRVVSE